MSSSTPKNDSCDNWLTENRVCLRPIEMDIEHKAPFDRLVDELGPQLTAYLKRMTGNDTDAADLLQETLMRIAGSLPQFEGRSSVKNWVFRIATNVAIDFLRRSKRVVLEEFGDDADISEIEEEDRLILDEMNSCVREVIDNLPPDYRAATVLFNLHGRSVAEIAEILGISVSLTKVRIHRGRKLLKESLNKQCTFYTGPDGNIRCDRKLVGINDEMPHFAPRPPKKM